MAGEKNPSLITGKHVREFASSKGIRVKRTREGWFYFKDGRWLFLSGIGSHFALEILKVRFREGTL